MALINPVQPNTDIRALPGRIPELEGLRGTAIFFCFALPLLGAAGQCDHRWHYAVPSAGSSDGTVLRRSFLRSFGIPDTCRW